MKRGSRAMDPGRAGFTLVELLISIILMAILLSAVTMAFVTTTETVAIAEARTQIYTNARYALDMMENDLLSCISFDSGLQAFAMENGAVTTPGSFPTYGVSNRHVPTAAYGAADLIEFIATTTVGDTMQTCKVTYELMPGNFAIGPDGKTPETGDSSHKQTVRSQRGLYTLVRRIRVPDPTAVIVPGVPPKYDQMAKDRMANTIADQELCHYVISFNLEYFDASQKFSQLEPSPFTRKLGGQADPLGNGQGANDTNPPPPANASAIRVPYVRATLVIVEDAGERQERTIQKAMWVPMG